MNWSAFPFIRATGGLIAGIAAYMKSVRPETLIIGVEPEDAACLYRALEAGELRFNFSFQARSNCFTQGLVDVPMKQPCVLSRVECALKQQMCGFN